MSETITPATGLAARSDLGGTTLERSAEQSTAALEAASTAMVQARFMMALRFPRRWLDVRVALLQACERPGFAGEDGASKEKNKGSAWFVKPVGQGIEGFSIRFAEECARAMGNLSIETSVVYEDAERRVVQVVVLDLQNNLSYPASLSIEKTREKSIKPGEVGKIADALRYRKNSFNKDLAIVPATDDEVLQRQGALCSKAIRNGILRLVPGDILAACEARIKEIRFGDAARDPQKVARDLADGFAKLNVKPAELALLLGHDLESSSPAELLELRALWKEIQAGTKTWKATLDETLRERNGEPVPPVVDPLLERLRTDPPQKIKTAAEVRATEDAPPKEPCPHPLIKPSALAFLPPSQSIVCTTCGEDFAGTAPAREPGEDDGDETPVLTSETAKPAPATKRERTKLEG